MDMLQYKYKDKTDLLGLYDTGKLCVSELRQQLRNKDLGFREFSLHKFFSLTEKQACYSSG